MRQNYMVLIDKPTLFFTGQSVVFFVFAVACTVFNFATIAEWKGFYLTAAVWVGISTLNLSKVCRDWNYADIFGGLPPEDHAECFIKVSILCKGSIPFRIFVWSSCILSSFLLSGIVWTWDDGYDAKGFITICTLWAEGSSFQLCKLLRDYRDLQTRKELSDNMPFQLLIVFSCIVAHVAIFLALATHRLESWQRMHLVAAWGFAVTTVFLVARHVRDRLDIFKLTAPSEVDKRQEGPYGNYGNNGPMQFPMGTYPMNPAGYPEGYPAGPPQYPPGMQSQPYVQQSPPSSGTMVQYSNRQIQMQHGDAQYHQYALERQHMPVPQDRHHDWPPQPYDGQHQATPDRGQHLAARNAARNEHGGYYDGNMMS
jgi:hypothetical protein